MALCFTVILLLWAILYFFLQMREVYDSIDNGLTNLKQEFILKSNRIPNFVESMEQFALLNIIVKEISQAEAETVTEHFSIAKVYFEAESEEEEVRMLTSAFYCTLNGKYYLIQFFTSTVGSDDLRGNLLSLLLGLWIVLILTLMIVSRVVIVRVNKPFIKVLDDLQKFRLDNSKIPDFPKTKIVEFTKFTETIKALLIKNINIFNEQKHFIENAAHELQTPLAIVIAKLEIMLEKYQSDEERAKEIAALINTINRMKRLNNSLLLSSKIRNNQFLDASTVNLRNVLEIVLADFEDIAAHKQIAVETTGNAAPLLHINDSLVHVLFANLVKNAIAHNIPNGKIVVSYHAHAITISNSGNAPLTDVFSRYKSDKSSGVGLSIVKSIADLYNVNIIYRFENGLHVFEIKLN